ncbi:MAG: TonB-dependent receptor [Saprospiraceae bacterium]|nr:TonB-dependent receptor [Saprospiraceae bacterium]
MLRSRFLLMGILFILCTLIATSQTRLRGEIVDEDNGEPLIGANIVIKGTSTGTVTDFDGSFEMRVDNLPVTLEISYIGYATIDLEVNDPAQVEVIKLSGTEGITLAITEVRGQRISDKQKAAPLTVESLDVLAIRETPSDNFYDGLGSLKGVDLTAASLGFKVVNTRGFNSTSPVRSLQIIDGVDNQSPGLNFSLGNFLGSSELDVVKVDLIVGASSAFYGPNAFNGVISMQTKNPFIQKGLSAMVKGGERNLLETAVRWADAFSNKNGLPVFAYKLNLSYLRANDWEADNFDPIDNSLVPASNPGRYDAVNVYGDEYFPGNDFSTFEPWVYPGLGTWYRTGYRESDLVDYNTRNLKANAALHFRLNPSRKEESPEVILSSSYANGTTVYQGDNRFSLKDIQFYQHRVEVRQTDKFFLRTYVTHEDAGDSYDPYFTALILLDSAKANRAWSQSYESWWRANVVPQIFEMGYPQLKVEVLPDGTIQATFDRDAANAWIAQHQNELTAWHNQAEEMANLQGDTRSSVDFYQPGTERFNQIFNRITSRKRTDPGGTLFVDRSALIHSHAEYAFNPSWTDKWVVGGNIRQYRPISEGTVFYDTADVTIRNLEYGLYTGLEKGISDNKVRLSATLRADKNENFDWLFSPAASIVYKPKANNYLRFSFSSAIRNPTLTDQYLFLNVGRATLSGNLDGVKDLITIESLRAYLNNPRPDVIERFDIDPVRPEKVKTFEIGYRSTLFNSVYLDASYYYSIYNDFLGFNIGANASFDPVSGFPTRIRVFRYAANSINQVTTQGFSFGLNYYFARRYSLNGNYSWNKLNKELEDDPIIPAFNTPEHKFNIGIAGRDLSGFSKNPIGFNVNYKWIDAFVFEGSPQFTGNIPQYSLLDAQVNYNVRSINTTIKIGASNLLNNQKFQTYGGPRVGRLAYVSILYDFKKAIN